MTRPPLALSLGDPAGIGPEIVVGAWKALRASGPPFVVLGDAGCLAAAPGGSDVAIRRVPDITGVAAVFGEALPVLHASADDAAAILGWIESGAALAKRGEASALVTAPITKASLYRSGFAFPGHTELLADLVPPPADEPWPGPTMMLTAGDDLRVSLVTIHEPLSRVSALLTTDRIVAAGMVTARALTRDFAIAAPRLAVAALNPHAGESGALGDEEVRVISPAIEALRAQGVTVSGPYPADTLFHEEARRRYDAVLAMYHDQALIPVKMLDFWGGVNVTLGLPLVRTSPDHGTGLDIAGKGVARPDSLISALRLAARIAANRIGE